MTARMFHSIAPVLRTCLLAMALVSFHAGPIKAQVSTFSVALAEYAAADRDIAQVYRDRGFDPIWTGPSDTHRDRRLALMAALENAPMHGLPQARYQVEDLMADMAAVASQAERAALEMRLSHVLLQYSRDIQTGVLVPSEIDAGLVRKIPLRDRAMLLQTFANGDPAHFLRSLAPRHPEYARLLKAKHRLEGQIAQGGWGPQIPTTSLEPGESGAAVIALRNRLVAMGYLKRSASVTYDPAIQSAVQKFQHDHSLEADGIAGQSTLTALNVSASARLQSVIVAMERERWLNRERGARHILVNLTDFSARVMDHDQETFRTRAVVGKNVSDRRTPEFSDVMEFMVINPSWNVPRSITTKEYLPKLQSNPNALSHLKVLDSRGRVVSRASANFANYTARTFPYRLKQPPSQSNALGLVKFMFPNRYNIYLHDTNAKNLFSREVRAYSHGCVRLHQPFEFAYTLLTPQEMDPEGYFQSILGTGRETRVNLEQPVPVHIIYRTAFTDAKGRLQFRSDVYGRDAAIWQALLRAGVSVPDLKG